ncbi:DUF2267 domain-containing protein [Actinomycetospora chiangmaiensis]|uniref:DUF2267 domain-containing protein n=1 Tax=Actinomycetospora chiangmaiensis TaxID=402650 RepID=UPI0003A3E722|nr:DUF2267 domain-containing protein [Actinomycetospora chiangmaiensis]
MRHQEFLGGVALRAGLERTDDAREGATAALAALADHLPTDDRGALADALPTLLAREAGLDGGPPPATTGSPVETVARRTGWPPERARYVLVAVVEELAAEDTDLRDRLRRALPYDLRPTGGPALPPDAPAAGAEGRPQPVDEDTVARALRRLTDWEGDVTGIVRTIVLPAERLDLVLDRVHGVEREVGQRARVLERTPTSLTLRARTESLAVVTEVDLALAARIDDVVASVGSGG